MGRTKTESATTTNPDVKDILNAIQRTKELKTKIHKELGIFKDIAEDSPEDIYEYRYKKPDLDHYYYMLTHGKCSIKGQAKWLESGYEFQRLRHFPKTQKQFCRIRCQICKKQLDEVEAARVIEMRKIKLETLLQEYQEEQAIRAEWEAEQILLGKM